MADVQHGAIPPSEGIHVVHAWETAELGNLSPTLADVGKIARTDEGAGNYAFHVLTGFSPGGEGGGDVPQWLTLAYVPSHAGELANLTSVPGGTVADALMSLWQSSMPLTTLVVSDASPTITLDATIQGAYVCSTYSGGPVSVIVPADTLAALPIGYQITIKREGTTELTVSGSDGSVALQAAVPAPYRARTRHSPVTLLKRAANTWDVGGDLAV